jgi:SAM-dependent methyltransferase
MDLTTTRFLLSRDGDSLLETAESLEGSFLQRVTILRKHYPAPIAGAALELLDLRRRAKKKFSRADRMFFTREALEQASGEAISDYRAERYRADSRVLDLACGIGGDTIGLARRCFVTAVDNDPVRLAMAERNLAVYDLSDRVKFVCADVTQIPLEADAAFLDPSRRVGGRRVVRLSEVSPPIEFIRRLIQAVPDCALKLSPATDDSELISLGGEIEFVSEAGECKEALVWLGEFKTVGRRATILPQRASLVGGSSSPAPVLPPGRYLYEPDPCIIRAHLIEQAADRIGTWKIDDRIAYLSSDELIDTPLAAAYQILETLPFNLKAVNGRLRSLGAGRAIVKKRGVPFEPREIERRLKLVGDKELVLVLTRVADRPYALICLQAGKPAPKNESSL